MGLFIAAIVLLLWLLGLIVGFMFVEPAFDHGWFYLYLLVQTWLFTGLFITAHDAMHGSISRHKSINLVIGYLATFLYAAMWYPRLLNKHKLHHRFSGTPSDPDYHPGNQNFFGWWFRFMMQYITVWQILVMALLFNVGLIWFSEKALILLWVLPAVLSTFQLFYFGTYWPHRTPHSTFMMPHRARSQPKLHWLAFATCYFFGYHFEHHAAPRTPWWKLYKIKI